MRAKWSLALLFLVGTGAGGCGRDAMGVPAPEAGGRNGGLPGIGTVVRMLPDGGLAALLGDGGLGFLVCGEQVRLGAACSEDTLPCVLSNLAGVCACLSGRYLCPSDTTSGPMACPATAATGSSCRSPMSICVSANTACLCGMGTYTCL